MISNYVIAMYVNFLSWHVHGSHSVYLIKWGVTPTQVPAKQVCETEWPTKSSSSKSARQSCRPTPRRASLRGEAADQVLVDQVGEAERLTKPSPSKPRDRPKSSGTPTPAATRHIIIQPHLDVRALYMMSARGSSPAHLYVPKNGWGMPPLPVESLSLSHKRSQQRSLNNDPHIKKDRQHAMLSDFISFHSTTFFTTDSIQQHFFTVHKSM
jgi:hypothetical protein